MINRFGERSTSKAENALKTNFSPDTVSLRARASKICLKIQNLTNVNSFPSSLLE